jgi:hypothetical protein
MKDERYQMSLKNIGTGPVTGLCALYIYLIKEWEITLGCAISRICEGGIS